MPVWKGYVRTMGPLFDIPGTYGWCTIYPIRHARISNVEQEVPSMGLGGLIINIMHILHIPALPALSPLSCRTGDTLRTVFPVLKKHTGGERWRRFPTAL